MKIVLDTNCLLVIIPKKSPYRKVFELIKKGKITICVTNEILNEYEEQLNKFYSQNIAQNIIRLLLELERTELITVYFNFNLIENDAEDNKFSDCAIASNADCIVTNDKHYNILNKVNFPKVKHIKLEDFCKLL